MTPKRGISLVELLLALSACGVILTLSAGLIERIMRVEMRARDEASVDRTALRLANAFRRDAWQATRATVSSSDAGAEEVLRLSVSEVLSVEYRQQSGTLRRTVFKGEQVLAQDNFRFPETAEIEIRQAPPSLISISIHLPPLAARATSEGRPPDAHTPPIALKVLARINRDGALRCDPSAFGDHL